MNEPWEHDWPRRRRSGGGGVRRPLASSLPSEADRMAWMLLVYPLCIFLVWTRLLSPHLLTWASSLGLGVISPQAHSAIVQQVHNHDVTVTKICVIAMAATGVVALAVWGWQRRHHESTGTTDPDDLTPDPETLRWWNAFFVIGSAGHAGLAWSRLAGAGPVAGILAVVVVLIIVTIVLNWSNTALAHAPDAPSAGGLR